jgi:hypothetical protein
MDFYPHRGARFHTPVRSITVSHRRHGGLFVDPDTVFLRDFRPAAMDSRFAAFGTRSGFNIYLSNALLRLRKGPDPLTRDILRGALKTVGGAGALICGGSPDDGASA